MTDTLNRVAAFILNRPAADMPPAHMKPLR